MEYKKIVEALLSDTAIFILFEVFFTTIFIYAYAKEHKWFNKKEGALEIVIKRGEKGWDNFNLAYGIASIIVLQLINSTEALKGYKTIISLYNLMSTLYLFFYNGWFRNKITGLINKSIEKEEKSIE